MARLRTHNRRRRWAAGNAPWLARIRRRAPKGLPDLPLAVSAARKAGMRLSQLVQLEIAFDGPNADRVMLAFDVPGHGGRVWRNVVGPEGVTRWIVPRPSDAVPLDLAKTAARIAPAEGNNHAGR